jgi:hypothetical protein
MSWDAWNAEHNGQAQAQAPVAHQSGIEAARNTPRSALAPAAAPAAAPSYGTRDANGNIQSVTTPYEGGNGKGPAAAPSNNTTDARGNVQSVTTPYGK